MTKLGFQMLRWRRGRGRGRGNTVRGCGVRFWMVLYDRCGIVSWRMCASKERS